MACLGAGPRKLVGNDVTSPKSFAILEIEAGELVSVEAYGRAD